MSNAFNDRPGASYWIIGGSALIWNLFGVMVYVMQVSASADELAAAYSADQVAFIEGTPIWAISAFAIAVTTGTFGCLSLLLGKSWAVPLFIISLVTILIQNVSSYLLHDAMALFGATPAIIQGAVITISAALIWYARHAQYKGWIR